MFLYGIKIMGEGLELAAGNKLKKLLEKITSNKIVAVLVGATITALIQSSAATTVLWRYTCQYINRLAMRNFSIE
jgi:phosphate:Na+ symporter